jgi:hypothetical protein
VRAGGRTESVSSYAQILNTLCKDHIQISTHLARYNTHISEVHELCNQRPVRALELQGHGVLTHIRGDRFLKDIATLKETSNNVLRIGDILTITN